MGNIIGSNIVNVFLVFAIGIFYGKLRVGTTKTQKNTFFMLGLTCLFLFLYLSGVSNKISGIILLISAVFITLNDYFWGVSGRTHEDAKTYKKIKKYTFSGGDFVRLSAALAGVILGGILTVLSVEQMSMLFGLS